MPFEIKDGELLRYTGTEETVQIPAQVQRIGEGAFERSGMRKMVFPPALREIGKKAFYRCDALCGVTFPASVRLIEKSAFERCDALHTVTFEGEVPDMESNVFYDSAHIEEIRYGGKVMKIAPYFADLQISVKYTRVYPDLILTGKISWRDLDARLLRMMIDYYELTHARGIIRAFQDVGFLLFRFLEEHHDEEHLIWFLEHDDLLTEQSLRKMLDDTIETVQMGGSPEHQMLVMRAAERFFRKTPTRFQL